MKTIGLIGGMSWESSIEYYRIINQEVQKRLGGLHSAKSVMVSVDFAEVEALQKAGNWWEAGKIMEAAAKSLELGGADFVILCTNTMHKLTSSIQKSIHIPFLHIADATADRITETGLHRVGLLGTRFTMEEDFYKGRLVEKYGLDVLVPELEQRILIHKVIYDELCLGVIEPSSRSAFSRIMKELVQKEAEGIILGCTEIGLLVSQQDSPVRLFDTTRIHAETAVDFALNPGISINQPSN
jgi:aspartate racemase